jgi:hypothetical protein
VELKDRFLRICDSETGMVLCQGPYDKSKTYSPTRKGILYISVDGKWFFNAESPKFDISEAVSDEIVEFVPKNDYNWAFWRDCDRIVCDIYRDFDMKELDPEIEPLVTEMNLWKGIKTQASCSGHGKYAPWVQFVAENPRTLQILLDVLRSPDTFPRIVGKFELSMDSFYPFTMIWSETPHICNVADDHEGVLLTLMAKNMGEEAYADILRLTHYMSETRNFFETNKVIKW